MTAATIRGGEKLAAYLRSTSRKVRNAAELRVGFLEGATYPDKNSTPVALVAAVQNFGSAASGIPPRPFFSDMVRDKSGEWPKLLGNALTSSDYDAEKALRLMGEEIKGELQGSIVSYAGTPLAEATVAAKGFDKQLIDSSHMLNSVDYEVEGSASS